MNTVETIDRKTGKHVNLNPKAVPVRAREAQILAWTEMGYMLYVHK